MRIFLIAFVAFCGQCFGQDNWATREWAYDDWKKDPNFTTIGNFIPREPKNKVWGIYQPAILQGAGVIQLMVREDSPEEVWRKFEEKFQYTLDGPTNGWIEDGKNLWNNIPVPVMYPKIGEEQHFQKGWKIGVLKTEMPAGSRLPWNHGVFYGIAIHSEKKLVFYFAEVW